MDASRQWSRVLGAACLLACHFAVRADDGSDPALRSYLAGNGLLNRGMYESAIEEYEEFLSEHASHGKAALARYGLGVCYYRLGGHAQAIESLSAIGPVDESFPFRTEVGTILGRCYVHAGELRKAADVLEKTVRADMEHPLADDATLAWIEAVVQLGEFEEARRGCALFFERWPDSESRGQVTVLDASAAMQLGRHEDAVEVLSLAGVNKESSEYPAYALLRAHGHHQLGQLEDAAAWYRKALERDEDHATSADAGAGLSSLMAEQGDWKQVEKMTRSWLKQYPDHARSADMVFLKGRVQFEAGSFDEAIESFAAAAESNSDLGAEVAYWQAKCRFASGDHDAAAVILERAVEDHSDSPLQPEMRYDLAVAYFEAGSFDSCVEAAGRFLRSFDSIELAGDALYLRSLAEHRVEHYESSAGGCRAFLSRFEDHARRADAMFLLAENLFLSDWFAESADAFEQFAGRYPDDDRAQQAQYRKGMALYRLERFDEAQQVLGNLGEKKGSRDATGGHALLATGDIHFQNERWEESVGALSRFLERGLKQPGVDDALLKLGLSCHRLGRFKEAMKHYGVLIRKFPESVHVPQAVFETGQAAAAAGDVKSAEKSFSKVIERHRDTRFAPFSLYQWATLVAQQQPEQSVKLLSQFLDSYDDHELAGDVLLALAQLELSDAQFSSAERRYRRFLDGHSGHDFIWLARAQLMIAVSRQDRYQEALDIADAIPSVQLDGLDASVRDTVVYEYAWCLRSLRRNEEAADAYRSLIESTDDRALADAASLELVEFLTSDHHDGAAPILGSLRSRMGEMNPQQRARAFYQIGMAAHRNEQWKEAADALGEFLELSQDQSLAHASAYFHGDALIHLGRHEAASRTFRTILESGRDSEYVEPAMLRTGECATALQHWPIAEQSFRNFLDRYPKSPQAYQARFGVGWARENQRQYGGAISAYRELIESHQGPTSARAQFQIGECLFAQEQWEEAARELLKVDILYAYPEWSAAALFEAGKCFERLQKPVQARDQYDQVLERFSDTQWGSMARQRRAKLAPGDLPGGLVRQGHD